MSRTGGWGAKGSVRTRGTRRSCSHGGSQSTWPIGRRRMFFRSRTRNKEAKARQRKAAAARQRDARTPAPGAGWRCDGCGADNLIWRWSCFRCQAEKPDWTAAEWAAWRAAPQDEPQGRKRKRRGRGAQEGRGQGAAGAPGPPAPGAGASSGSQQRPGTRGEEAARGRGRSAGTGANREPFAHWRALSILAVGWQA